MWLMSTILIENYRLDTSLMGRHINLTPCGTRTRATQIPDINQIRNIHKRI